MQGQASLPQPPGSPPARHQGPARQGRPARSLARRTGPSARCCTEASAHRQGPCPPDQGWESWAPRTAAGCRHRPVGRGADAAGWVRCRRLAGSPDQAGNAARALCPGRGQSPGRVGSPGPPATAGRCCSPAVRRSSARCSPGQADPAGTAGRCCSPAVRRSSARCSPGQADPAGTAGRCCSPAVRRSSARCSPGRTGRTGSPGSAGTADRGQCCSPAAAQSPGRCCTPGPGRRRAAGHLPAVLAPVRPLAQDGSAASVRRRG